MSYIRVRAVWQKPLSSGTVIVYFLNWSEMLWDGVEMNRVSAEEFRNFFENTVIGHEKIKQFIDELQQAAAGRDIIAKVQKFFKESIDDYDLKHQKTVEDVLRSLCHKTSDAHDTESANIAMKITGLLPKVADAGYTRLKKGNNGCWVCECCGEEASLGESERWLFCPVCGNKILEVLE